MGSRGRGWPLLLGGLVVLGLGVWALVNPTAPPVAPLADDTLPPPPSAIASEAPPDVVVATETTPFVGERADPAAPMGPAAAVRASGILTGRVLFKDQGVPDAKVELLNDFSPSASLVQLGEVLEFVVTDAEGAFAFSALQSPVRCALRVTHQDYAMLRLLGIALEHQKGRPLLIKLAKGYPVSGRVADAKGNPLSAVRVAVFDVGIQTYEPEQQFEAAATSDPSGNYSLHAVSPGLKKLVASREDLATEATPPLRVIAPRTGVDLVLAPGLSLSGFVLDDATDKPLANVRVAARKAGSSSGMRTASDLHTLSSVTGEDGRFRIPGIAASDYSLWAYLPTHEPSARQVVRAGQHGVVVRLRRAASLRGRVVDDATGQPVRSYTLLRATNPDLVIPSPGKTFHVDEADGRFSVAGVPPGRHFLIVRAEGYVETVSEPLLVVAGEDPPEVALRLSLGATLAGKFQNGAGEGIAGVRVRAQRIPRASNDMLPLLQPLLDQSGETREGLSNPDGGFLLENLREGDWRLEVAHDHFALDRVVSVEIQRGEKRVLPPLDLSGGGRVEVLIKDAGAGADARARVVLEAVSGTPMRREQGTNPEGIAVFAGIPPGDYYLNVTQRRGMLNLAGVVNLSRGDRAVHTVRAGQTLKLEL